MAWNEYEQSHSRSSEANILATSQPNAHLQSPPSANSIPANRERTTKGIELSGRRRKTREFILASSDDDGQPRKKKFKTASDFFGENVEFIPPDEVEEELDLDNGESPFKLTAAQEAVVKMAINGHNIFLTGAAGSGKTATLREILRRLRKKYSEGGSKGPTDAGGNNSYVQVVAPTGIAALSLNGRTTYSFAGWYVRSFLSMWFPTSIHLS